MKKDKKKVLTTSIVCSIISKYMIMYQAVEKYYNIKLSVIFEDFDDIILFIEYVQKMYLDIKEVE